MLIKVCSCSDHRGFVVDERRRADPTGLTSVRRRYESDMVRRFRELKRVVMAAVVRLDVLGLKKSNRPDLTSTLFGSAFAGGALPSRDAVPVPTPGEFAFERSSQKVNAFMRWLRQAQSEGILEVMQGTDREIAGAAAWQNVYIDSAYQKGIRDAYSRVGQQIPGGIGGAFNQPVHADAAGLIYTRAYEALEGVTNVMSTSISRTLAQGMIEGMNANELGSLLGEQIEKIGVTRGRLIARTEMTAAYAEATLNSYEEMEVEGVEVEAEVATAGDDVVCPECEALEGKTFSIEEARGLLPVHPNCRCALIPVVGK